jgi:hypothetical protein
MKNTGLFQGRQPRPGYGDGDVLSPVFATAEAAWDWMLLHKVQCGAHVEEVWVFDSPKEARSAAIAVNARSTPPSAQTSLEREAVEWCKLQDLDIDGYATRYCWLLANNAQWE